jgi:hypothetical protein
MENSLGSSHQSGVDALCKKIESTLDNWKLAEVALHRAKRNLIAETPTILGFFKQEEIDTLKDPSKTRRRINECQSKNESLIKEYRKQYSLKECPKMESNADCAYFKTEIAELEGMLNRKTCEKQYETAQRLISVSELATAVENSKAEQQVMQKFLSHVAASDCKKGETGGACKGEEGGLQTLRSSHNDKLAMIADKCPNLPLQAPANLPPKSEYMGYIDPNNTPVAAAPHKGRLPSSEEGNWFTRIFKGSPDSGKINREQEAP